MIQTLAPDIDTTFADTQIDNVQVNGLPVDGLPAELPTNIFDLTQWLIPGVKYGHLQLIRIFWRVADLGLNAVEGDPTFRIGKAFMNAIYEWHKARRIEMTVARDSDGSPCDFWTAVFMSKHPDNKDFRRVEGYLMVLPESEAPLWQRAFGVLCR